ncbi:MarR family winged helix-turn-helix transcriptional regulator [Sphingomonas sp.]|uniref:MarR family winged helix-turn-helix transcriptional regulator n=1 Tax=Sphingomonas sp. TaxID=28214 RepID=UPI003AFF9E16
MLADFYRRSHRVIDRSMSEQGASFARARLLLQIMREGPLRSADLAAMFSYAPRTVTEAVDGLERDGLVRRDPDPLDRRAKRISLTPAGLAAAEGADRVRREHIERVFGTLTVAECEELTRLIEKLNDRLAELGGASDSRP